MADYVTYADAALVSPFDPEHDDMLPNGARIIDRRKVGERWVWLCEREGCYQPYVTWISHENTPYGTVCGNYFSRFTRAVTDFWERVTHEASF